MAGAPTMSNLQSDVEVKNLYTDVSEGRLCEMEQIGDETTETHASMATKGVTTEHQKLMLMKTTMMRMP